MLQLWLKAFFPITIVVNMPKRKKEEHASKRQSFSPAAYKLLESWAWGDMSAASLQELAQSIVMTYGHQVEDVAELARLGAHGNSKANCQRDLFRLPQLASLKVPEPYLVEADVITYQAGSAQLVQATIAVLRPFDWVQTLHKHGLIDLVLGSATNVKSFWSQVKATDPKLYNNPVKDVPAWKEKVYPFYVHGDAGPHQKHDSINVHSMMSLVAPPMGVDYCMLLLCAIPEQCRATEKKCKNLGLAFKEDTWDAVGRVLAQSWQDLLYGDGPIKGIIWVAPADCDHLSKDYGLPHHSKNQPCMRCKGNKSDIPISDVRPSAKWRHHCYTPEQLAREPLTTHWLLTAPGVGHFSFVYDTMHCLDIGVSSHVVANVFHDCIYKDFAGTKPTKMKLLNERMVQGYNELNISHTYRVRKLEFQYFGSISSPHQNYPELMSSAIKAAQTRHLVPVCLWILEKHCDATTEYQKRRLYCVKALSDLYGIIDRSPLFLSDEDHILYKKTTQKFLLHYLELSKMAAATSGLVGKYQWSFVPKFHYMEHIAEDSAYISPKAVWCYSGESMVGTTTRLAQACLSGMAPHNVPKTVVSKYRLGKHLQFHSPE